MIATLSHGSIHDLLVGDGEGVALIDTHLIWLSPLAALIVGQLQRGQQDLRLLSQIALDAFGPPPPPADVTEVIQSALRTLERQGLITLE